MPVSKRQKVAQLCDKCFIDVFSQNSFDQTFENLPIEIIENIFEFLPLKELAQMRLTCHKFQDAVRKHFELKRQCGVITIETRLRQPLAYFGYETEMYKIRLRNLIPHVKLIQRHEECVADAFKFINDNF